MQILTVKCDQLTSSFLVPNFQNLMINETLNTVAKLQVALIVAEVYVSSLSKDTPYQKFEQRYLV